MLVAKSVAQFARPAPPGAQEAPAAGSTKSLLTYYNAMDDVCSQRCLHAQHALHMGHKNHQLQAGQNTKPFIYDAVGISVSVELYARPACSPYGAQESPAAGRAKCKALHL